MTYRTPELQLVGAAQGIVLGVPSLPAADDCIDQLDTFVSRNNPSF